MVARQVTIAFSPRKPLANWVAASVLVSRPHRVRVAIGLTTQRTVVAPVSVLDAASRSVPTLAIV